MPEIDLGSWEIKSTYGSKDHGFLERTYVKKGKQYPVTTAVFARMPNSEDLDFVVTRTTGPNNPPLKGGMPLELVEDIAGFAVTAKEEIFGE